MNSDKSSVKKPINKKIFKFEYLLILVLGVLLLCLFFSSSGVLSFAEKSSNSSATNYESSMEKKLENLLSVIEGAGSVNVMISVDGTTQKEYLKNSVTKTENGVEIIEETTVFVNGKPELTKENYPEILGVVIICQGGDDIKVKMAITEVITTVLPVTSENIRILKKK